MQKKEQAFANLVRSYRKKHVGKGPEKVEVTFKGSWAIAYMTGALSKVDNFYLKDERNEEMLRYARTEVIKQLYAEINPDDMEELVGAKFIKLFTDVDLADDEVVSIFVFDKSIE
ncbi:DUF2294 domain-containing protein [Staphylococcus sp. 18_1_E_LY]|uniref:DUF2294 domain-containing protein n=1 Tax=Staphylococcus lloydii TaxID=2781774 RepID=A0A7T1AZT4_9STAP|nr:DUF2294 domain-containing protein [Staphylococcus lloydii]MBF7027476.1 DUF2294 domain-containing protein [Staphylococcus lloydii]QPM75133.1 DUF2294 domain-containing protein [Staphylococcus lloydii]